MVKLEEDEVKGYFVEIRRTDQIEWSRCNTNAIVQTSFTVTGLKPLAMYWVRVIATNEGGEGHPLAFDNCITAMPPPSRHKHCSTLSVVSLETAPQFDIYCSILFDFTVKPKFTDRKMKNFMVVKAGNTVRFPISFEVLSSQTETNNYYNITIILKPVDVKYSLKP